MDEVTLHDLRDLSASWRVTPPVARATRDLLDLVAAALGAKTTSTQPEKAKPTTLDEQRAAALTYGTRIVG